MNQTQTRLASVPTVTPPQALGPRTARIVDLRTPSEFAEDHLPGARNVPLFDDAERALIGTLYKRESPERAFDEGRRIAAQRIAGLVAAIAEATGWDPPDEDLAAWLAAATRGGMEALERAVGTRPAEGDDASRDGLVVLHCWRGGLRSRSVVAFLRALGLDRAVALEGGYKRYRRHVLEGLARWQAPPDVFVLRGLTGVGKTLVLRELERARPGWTVDLEGLAGHRSSILGMVGLEPTTQKTFDSLLFERLGRGFPGPAVFEGESRKVGDSILPVGLWRAMQGGRNVLLRCGVARRVEVLIEDYLARPENRAELARQLPFIERRLGPVRWAGRLVGLLEAGADEELVELLLEHYYDPLYRHSEQGRAHDLEVDSTDPRRAADELAAWIERTSGPPTAP